MASQVTVRIQILHDKNIKFEIEFEVETHEKTDPPEVKIDNKNFVLSNGFCKINFICESKFGFDIVWKNKTGTDTICNDNGDIIADKNFKIKKVWIDGILAEPWFITDCIYYPQYFRKLHNFPTEIKSPYVISFPGLIKFRWEGDFWQWYKQKRLSYARIENLELDPDRVWKFAGSYDMYPDLVGEFESLING